MRVNSVKTVLPSLSTKEKISLASKRISFFLRRKRGHLLISTHHKCASLAIRQVVQELGEMNQLRISITQNNPKPIINSNICLLRNAEWNKRSLYHGTNAIHIIRSPMSVIESAYFSHARTHSIKSENSIATQRRVLQKTTLEEGLFLTLAYCERANFNREVSGPLSQLRDWDYTDGRDITIRVEDFGDILVSKLREASGELGIAWKWPEDYKYTFASLSGGRRRGEIDETSHYRSGNSETWRNTLPKAIINYIRHHYRSLLEKHYPEDLED